MSKDPKLDLFRKTYLPGKIIPTDGVKTPEELIDVMSSIREHNLFAPEEDETDSATNVFNGIESYQESFRNKNLIVPVMREEDEEEDEEYEY